RVEAYSMARGGAAKFSTVCVRRPPCRKSIGRGVLRTASLGTSGPGDVTPALSLGLVRRLVIVRVGADSPRPPLHTDSYGQGTFAPCHAHAQWERGNRPARRDSPTDRLLIVPRHQLGSGRSLRPIITLRRSSRACGGRFRTLSRKTVHTPAGPTGDRARSFLLRAEASEPANREGE